MATTTNYSWTTPDDTDLVKDGAAAIRTLGSSADTTVKNLNPGTTAGDIDYYTSATAKARVAIGTANQVLQVNSGGTAPEWGVDPVADVITTAGDLIYGTAADTVARLGIGTAGQLLQVNSGATAPEWVAAPSSGSMTLLNTGGTTLTGAFVEITSIPGTYQQLYIVVNNYLPVTDTRTLRMRTNVSTSNYASINQGDPQDITGTDASWEIIPASDDTTSNSIFVGYIPDYANTTTYKFVFPFMGLSTNPTTTTNFNYDPVRFKVLNNTAAVTSLRFFSNSGNMTSGTVFVYGVK